MIKFIEAIIMFTLTAQELKLGGITKIKNVLKQTKDFIIKKEAKILVL